MVRMCVPREGDRCRERQWGPNLARIISRRTGEVIIEVFRGQ